MAEDPNKVEEEKTKQERYRQENEMARGPVSRGASNKDAPMYQKQRQPSSTPHRGKANSQTPDYNKMIRERTSGTSEGTGMQTDRDLGTAGGGTIPNPGRGTGKSRGGRATSNSTVAGGGTSGGGLIGQGATRDRGTMSDEEMDTSTNMERELSQQRQGEVPTRIANQEPRTPSSRNAKKTGRRAQGKKA